MTSGLESFGRRTLPHLKEMILTAIYGGLTC